MCSGHNMIFLKGMLINDNSKIKTTRKNCEHLQKRYFVIIDEDEPK